MELDELKTVDLRTSWKHEAFGFTHWLAEQSNLDKLGIEIGVDIELVQTEAQVGRFSADIVAQEINTGRKVVIENQLETTDHSHLGQILTYAAGIGAEYIIWVVKDVRDEHKQALDWLNEHTDEKLNFFLVRIELWQIGSSRPAPKFVTVCRPNYWTKTIRGEPNQRITNLKLLQLEFWKELCEFATLSRASILPRPPTRAQFYCDIRIGRSDCYVCLTVLFGFVA